MSGRVTRRPTVKKFDAAVRSWFARRGGALKAE
jgi:hypothetical protein